MVNKSEFLADKNHKPLVDKEGYLTEEDGSRYTIKDLGQLTEVVERLKDPLIWDKELDIPIDHPYKQEFNFPFGLWFRGEEEAYPTPMLPSLFRPTYFYDETSMYNEFLMENSAEWGASHFTTFEWLTLMQHYQLPTRLLDWTENPLIATYFSIANAEKSKHPHVYILNSLRLNQLSEITGILTPDQLSSKIDFSCIHEPILKSGSNPPVTTIPVAVHAKRLSPRLHSQFGMFTLHGGKRVWEIDNPPEGVVPADETFAPEYYIKNLFKSGHTRFPVITKLQLSNDSEGKDKLSLNEQLEIFGVHEGRIFPELEHNGRSIERKWRKKVIKS